MPTEYGERKIRVKVYIHIYIVDVDINTEVNKLRLRPIRRLAFRHGRHFMHLAVRYGGTEIFITPRRCTSAARAARNKEMGIPSI